MGFRIIKILLYFGIVMILFPPRMVDAIDRSMDEMLFLLNEEKKELIQLKNEIEKHDRKISSVGRRQNSLLRELRKIQHQVKLKERELDIYKWNAKINKKKVARLTKNILNTEENLSKKIIELKQWLRVIYKEGGLFPVRILFSADGITDLLQRVRFMQMVTDYDTRLFQEYEDKLQRLNQEKDSLLQVRSDLILLQNDAENKTREYKNKKEIRRRFLRKLKREKSLGMQMQKELIRASLELDKIIADQEKKISEGERFDILDHKGRLDLPVKGKVLNHFGKKRDKRYDSYIVYNGINIKIPKNSSVRAIYSGKVLYTGFLEGYGNLVILGHGNDIHSVYGHLNKILCHEGQTIRRQQILGNSGDSGSIIGNSLYFELRQNGKAIDPSSWIRMAKN